MACLEFRLEWFQASLCLWFSVCDSGSGGCRGEDGVLDLVTGESEDGWRFFLGVTRPRQRRAVRINQAGGS